jgi:hypothetical protein
MRRRGCHPIVSPGSGMCAPRSLSSRGSSSASDLGRSPWALASRSSSVTRASLKEGSPLRRAGRSSAVRAIGARCRRRTRCGRHAGRCGSPTIVCVLRRGWKPCHAGRSGRSVIPELKDLHPPRSVDLDVVGGQQLVVELGPRDLQGEPALGHGRGEQRVRAVVAARVPAWPVLAELAVLPDLFTDRPCERPPRPASCLLGASRTG